MRWCLSLLWIVAACLPANAQTTAPEVDQAEVLRLGNLVQIVGEGQRGLSDTDAYAAAMGPPASDADKWFISVLSMRGCPGCEKLKRDWSTNTWLLALANPADPKQSWAHYTVYDKDDRSQAFRFQNVKVTAYPTILVQPPRSNRYGAPSTVVYQGVYQGDPEKLARDITQAIRQYVAKLQQPNGPVRENEPNQVGVDPPWQPVPRVDPFQPSPQPYQPFPTVDPIIPPPSPLSSFPWSAVFTLLSAGFSLPAAAAVAIWAFYRLRANRQSSGQSPQVDQVALARLLEQLIDAQNPANRSIGKSRRRSS